MNRGVSDVQLDKAELRMQHAELRWSIRTSGVDIKPVCLSRVGKFFAVAKGSTIVRMPGGRSLHMAA